MSTTEELDRIETILEHERHLLLMDLNELEYIEQRKGDRERYIGSLIERKWALQQKMKQIKRVP